VNANKLILLLGRRDQPTDGVSDYCAKLRENGAPRGLSFELSSVQWAENGWRDSLNELRKLALCWRNCWVLLQYTTLAWSFRGFPLRAPHVLEALRQSGARPGVVFHDFMPLQGSGAVGTIRQYCHRRVLRKLYDYSDVAIFTVPLNQISWLPKHSEKSVFIPVGANCPEMIPTERDYSPKIKTVAVYGVTGGDRTVIEIADIATALKRATEAVGPIRLVLFGRGSRESERILRTELASTDVQIDSMGLLSPNEVNRALAAADVLLFVRGQISSRRGSSIAGIASGLPIVCYSGPETAWPITEAGILTVPLGDREALATALETILLDDSFRITLSKRSSDAHKKYFSWDAITKQFAKEFAMTKD
jgi:glycosyltransferase involved in cell wall biosynthesis